MKWRVESLGEQKVWYSEDIVLKIKELVQNTINKRPHSDNTALEKILKIIEEADNGCN